MQRRSFPTVSILLGTGANTALPGDPFRLGFIRLSRVLWLSLLLVVMLGGLLEPEAAAQTVSFGAKTDFGTGDSPRSVAVGDFNGDGTLDLAVANANSATVSILLGTGTGSFGVKTDFGTGNNPLSVAVGDFNGNGKLDLAVTNINSNTVSILLGTGTGSFGAKTDFGTGFGPFSVAVGDFNGDGALDLAVANYYSDTVSILLGTGTGSFGAK
ncbi:MAG: VCBS repeat-containing protein, partial [Acidobacteriota bacterium]